MQRRRTEWLWIWLLPPTPWFDNWIITKGLKKLPWIAKSISIPAHPARCCNIYIYIYKPQSLEAYREVISTREHNGQKSDSRVAEGQRDSGERWENSSVRWWSLAPALLDNGPDARDFWICLASLGRRERVKASRQHLAGRAHEGLSALFEKYVT